MIRSATLVLVLLLPGCALPPPTNTTLAESGIRAPDAWVSPAAPGPPGSDWLVLFDDPALQDLVAEALAGNLDLRAAAARVRAAQARAVIAGADALPQLDASGDATRRSVGTPSGQRSTGNSFNATLSAAWEVDLWDRLADRTRAASLDASASAADHAAARLSLAGAVARAWFDTLEASAQVALAQQSVDTFRDNLAVVQDGFRAGLASALDLRLERANLAGAISRLAARRVDHDAIARRLEVLLGRYPGNRIAAGANLPVLAHPVPAGVPAQVLARRPDVRAAATRLAAADARLDVALKNRLPGLTLTGNGGVSSDALRQLLDFKSVLLSIAAGITAPLLRGGALDAERALARAQIDEALAQYAQAVLVAFREVEGALSAESLLAQQHAALEDAARESGAAEELALERYRAGLVDIVTWLEARRRAFDARSALLSVSNQRLQNRIALHLALGGGFSGPEPAPGAPGSIVQ